MPNPLDEIRALLDHRQLDAFVGRCEDQWFDAKEAMYDLDAPRDRWELAKDVSAFANSGGGFLIVGLKTEPLVGERRDQVVATQLIPDQQFDPQRTAGILREYLSPVPDGLRVYWTEHSTQAGLGVGVIHVPPQPTAARVVLMARAFDDDALVKRIVFGIARRDGADSHPSGIEELHVLLQNGRSPTAERLTRIEAKIDALAAALSTLTSAATAADVVDRETQAAETLGRRLEDLLSTDYGDY